MLFIVFLIIVFLTTLSVFTEHNVSCDAYATTHAGISEFLFLCSSVSKASRQHFSRHQHVCTFSNHKWATNKLELSTICKPHLCLFPTAHSFKDQVCYQTCHFGHFCVLPRVCFVVLTCSFVQTMLYP